MERLRGDDLLRSFGAAGQLLILTKSHTLWAHRGWWWGPLSPCRFGRSSCAPPGVKVWAGKGAGNSHSYFAPETEWLSSGMNGSEWLSAVWALNCLERNTRLGLGNQGWC